MSSTAGAGELVLKEKGAGFVASCSVLLAGVWPRENTLSLLIVPKEGLGASIIDERVLDISGVLTMGLLCSILKGLCDPKVKGRGEGEDCGGTTGPKALVVFVGFPSRVGASPSEMEDGTFPSDEDLDVASSKLNGLFKTGNEKGCFGSMVVIDPSFNASGFASVGLLEEKGIAAVGVASEADAEEGNPGAKVEPEEDDDVPVAVISNAESILSAGLSSKQLDSFSPSQKGF